MLRSLLILDDSMRGGNMLGEWRAIVRRSMVGMGCAALLLAGAPACATAFGTLVFNQPTGSIGPNDSVLVSVAFTLDPKSDPIVIQNGQVKSGGFTDPQLIARGIDPSAVTYQVLQFLAGCDGNTFEICSGSLNDSKPYEVSFPAGSGPSLPFNLTLDPGETLVTSISGYTPNPAPVPTGIYTLYDVNLYLLALHVDSVHGFELETDIADATLSPGSCPDHAAECAFTRTVVAPATSVPEPATWTMFIGGFGMMGIGLRRLQRFSARTA
jgi:hypothetical protein